MLHKLAKSGFGLGLVLLAFFAFSGMSFAIGITGCQEINSSGGYYLHNDLQDANISIPETALDYACIKIVSSDVLFDCNGSTMNNTVNKTIAIFVNETQDNITIQNCPEISNYTSAVYTINVSNLVVDNVNVYNTSAERKERVYGLYIQNSTDSNITNNNIYNTSGGGISGAGIYVSYGNNLEISGNYVNDSGDNFKIGSVSNANITNNKAEYGDTGFYVFQRTGYAYSGNTITGNNASHNSIDGFDLWYGNKTYTFSNNRAHNSSEYGFRLINTSNAVVSNNWATENGFGGFAVEIGSGRGNARLKDVQDVGGSNNSIVYNYAYNNNGTGIIVASDSINNISHNDVYNSNGSGIYLRGTANNTVSYNNVTYCNESGIVIETPSRGTNNTLMENNAWHNKEHGFVVDYDNNNTLVENDAYNNSMYGFYFIDTAGNNFTGNTVRDNVLGAVYSEDSNLTMRDIEIKGEKLNVSSRKGGHVLQMENVIFDSAAGSGRAVNVSVDDVLSSGFLMGWTAEPGQLPWNYSAFGGFLDIENTTPGVVIDNITWHWTSAQSSGYNESKFELWELSDGAWTKLNFTLDEAGNRIWVENLTVASQYGVLYNGTGNFSELYLYGANVSNVTRHGRFNGSAAQSSPTEGGNLTGIDVSSASLTGKWAAFYGDVVGEIVLRGASGSNYVYSWNWTASDGGAVCVSTNSSLVNPNIVLGGTGSDIDNAWNYTATDADSGANTFNQTNCTIDIGAETVDNSSYADTGPAGGFHTCAVRLADNPVKDEMMFCAEIIPGGTTWDGGTGDFELMVPAPEAVGSTETYYFYANLN
ncbi:hypothetical protein GF318_05810 [Candidatus Micrarchaeota archaeon]|nr:hypothetical protein [Candidatus Micrarchaeota archaeon]